MTRIEARRILEASIEDFRISRSERKDLRELIESLANDPQGLSGLESLAFEIAEQKSAAGDILTWLRQFTTLLSAIRREAANAPEQRLYFSPQDDCPQLIAGLIRSARSEIRVCVFTITDNRISEELIAAKNRRVDVRIISDDDKALDRGSDLDRLANSEIPIALDREGHMHHKFAVFDQRISISGSYNWTRGAAESNHENILLSHDLGLAAGFLAEFENLWRKYQN